MPLGIGEKKKKERVENEESKQSANNQVLLTGGCR